MTHASLPAERDLRRRWLSFQPFTYGHVWLWTAIGVGLPVLAIVSVLGFVSGWSRPWPGLAFELPLGGVALNGIARSVWLRRLPRRAPGG
ncbi:MAG TPA: hypothetical protein VEL03_14050 [Streptosporangiaceae bacterium]|nr:hypothetical protein [Streptosporangiaceae bacterium]